MSNAYRCEICDTIPRWTITRTGDTAVSWACPDHLTDVCDRLQHQFEQTQLTVTDYHKAMKWAQIAAEFDTEQ